MDEAWNRYFGRTDFTVERREKILIINFYLPDSRTVVVTAERDFPIKKVHELYELVESFQAEA